MPTIQKNRRTRLLVVSRAYRPDAGGMERLSFELTNELKRQPNLEVRVLSYRGPRLLSPLFVLLMAFPALLYARRTDIVLLGDPLLAKVGWLIKKTSKAKVAVVVHGLDVVYPSRVYRLYLRAFFTRLDLYLPISRHAKELLSMWHVTGHEAVVNPGVYDRMYDDRIEREALNTVLNRSTNTNIVLFTVGRLVARKGHSWFITHVLPKLPVNVLYAIAGTGPELNNIITAAETARVADRILLLGRIGDADLKILYNTVDAFVQPNIVMPHDAEGFGLVLLEAALCGLPVFAASIEGIPDAITSAANGTLLPSANTSAWVQALTIFSHHPQRSQSARDYTRNKFLWDRQAILYRTKLLETIA